MVVTTRDYMITIKLAKQFGMIQYNEQSRLARNYFISMEEKQLEMYKKPITHVEALRAHADALEREEIVQKLLAQAKANSQDDPGWTV